MSIINIYFFASRALKNSNLHVRRIARGMLEVPAGLEPISSCSEGNCLIRSTMAPCCLKTVVPKVLKALFLTARLLRQHY
ncbi:MAG TPA: hypothetical protein VKM55_19565 [Candidatus Lokiarchaeia archaeon]|nr:hypothetical protein [Candidatus Lokiarchaeia archaeon]